MSPILEKLGTITAELRRRKVFRAAGLYLVGAWVVIEVTATVLPLLYFPEWVIRGVVVAAVLGFPIALVLAWAFDLTPEGVQRTAPSDDVRLLPASARAGLVLVTVLATGVAGWGARGLWLAPPPGDTPLLDPYRVAVLYFDDFSEGSRLGFLADGLTEALIHELAQIEPLKVVSRNGVKPYRSHALPLDSLARLLGVGTLVEGSVEGSGSQLRATVQLIDTRTGLHLLSHQLQMDGGDVLALRDSLVTRAALLLGQALGRELEVERRRRGTQRPEAWEPVQRARRLIDDADELRWRLGDVDAARAALLRADALAAEAAVMDRDWAEPPLLRASIRSALARLQGVGRPGRDAAAIREGIAHAEEALARVPEHADALAWRGTLRSQLSWLGGDSVETLLRQAESDFRRAVAADDGSARGWVGLAELLRVRGEFAEAALAAERALLADPFLIHAEQSILFTLGHIWLELEQFDRAVRWAEEGRSRYPAVPAFSAELLAIVAGWEGAQASPDTAWALVRAVEEGYGMAGIWPEGHLQAAAVLARAGAEDSARAVVERVRAVPSSDPWRDYYEAHVRLHMGEPDAALDLLAAFIERVPHRRGYIAKDWWWKPLRDRPRFQALVLDD